MNIMAKNFLLNIKDFEIRKLLKISFEIKVTKDKVIDDITTIIFKNLTLKQCLILKSLISDDEVIVTWINQTFQEGINFMIMFTQNTWEIIIENNLSIYHHESINNNQEIITSLNVQRDSLNYTLLIPPDLYKYLNFTNCLLLSNEELYIRAVENVEKMNCQFLRNILLMFCHFQSNKNDRFEDNIKRLNKWLLLCQNRQNKFDGIIIREIFSVFTYVKNEQ